MIVAFMIWVILVIDSLGAIVEMVLTMSKPELTWHLLMIIGILDFLITKSRLTSSVWFFGSLPDFGGYEFE